MNLCSSGHPEICHNERVCPFCEFWIEKSKEITDLENKIKVLEEENYELENGIPI